MAKPARTRLTDAEIDRQLDAGGDVYGQKRAAGLYATDVRYDRAHRRFVLELTNGYLLGVPISTLPQLAEASVAQLAAVEVSPAGMALRVPALDADFSVPGLVLSMTAGIVGQSGGRATPARKKRAARANGAKGGRPRKRTAA
jgi:hypothetical protein